MPKGDLDMKGDWNRRAIDNARYYIATPVDDDDEQAFDRSGERDVAAFFSGLEHLLHAEQTVLDIGCGIGRMDQFVAPRVSRLCGIDVSGEMVQRARVRFAHLDNVEFVEGDGWTLAPIPDASVGLVFSHIVFQHMPREVVSSYITEVARVLSPGGHFVFQVPEAVAGAPEDPPANDTFEMRFYEEDDLSAMIEANGLLWLGCRRFKVESPQLDFNQLRVHARRPV